jgi:hypothetical protein
MPSNWNQQFDQQMRQNQVRGYQHTHSAYEKTAQLGIDAFNRARKRWHNEQQEVLQKRQAARRGDATVSLKKHLESWPVGSAGNSFPQAAFLCLLIALVVLAMIAIAATSGPSRTVGAPAPQSVTGVTSPGVTSPGRTIPGVTTTTAHIRTGPSTAFPISDTLQAGQAVRIECRTATPNDPWDLLASPYAGRYIKATLVRSPQPPRCAS